MGLFGGSKKQGASPARRRVTHAATHAAVQAAAGAAAMPAVAPRKANAKSAKKAAPKSTAPKAERTPRLPLPWREWALGSMPVLAVTLVLGLLVSGWKLLDYVGSVPVSRVAVTGTLLHVDRKLLVERVQPLLAGAGFMTVDLQGIRAAVMELPWVADVAIQRRWPDQLVIAVTEQEAIARWGKDGLLNRRGEVFRPEPLGDVAGLPVLFGPDTQAAEVVARYAEMRELLAEQKLALASLGTDERGSWSATLQGGVVLRLGTGDVLKKMRSFSRVYHADLAAQMERIAYIDLRYSNGVAVGWRRDGQAAGEQEPTMISGVNGHG